MENLPLMTELFFFSEIKTLNIFKSFHCVEAMRAISLVSLLSAPGLQAPPLDCKAASVSTYYQFNISFVPIIPSFRLFPVSSSFPAGIRWEWCFPQRVVGTGSVRLLSHGYTVLALHALTDTCRDSGGHTWGVARRGWESRKNNRIVFLCGVAGFYESQSQQREWWQSSFSLNKRYKTKHF